jgi:transposase
MSKQNKRRNFDGNFKAKVAIEAIQEKLTLSELAAKHNVFPTQISEWKKEFIAGAGSVFENNKDKKADKSEDVIVVQLPIIQTLDYSFFTNI